MIQHTAESMELARLMKDARGGPAQVALERGMTYADYRRALEQVRREFVDARARAINRKERRAVERGLRNCDLKIARSRDEFAAAAEQIRRKRTETEGGN